MSRSEIIRFLILRTIGNFLVLFAVFGVFATFGPVLYFEIRFRVIQFAGIRYVVKELKELKPSPLGKIIKEEKVNAPAPQNNSTFAKILSGEKEEVLIPKDTEFSIVIPKIGANAKVFPNIDSSNEDEFLPVLAQGVAHAKGTVFPGMKGNIYLFAHSTDIFWNVGRYNAVFYLLKDLTKGDEIVIFFENRRHDYTVDKIQIVDETDVAALTRSQSTKQEVLVLQSCWPPGTTWKRLLVFARPK